MTTNPRKFKANLAKKKAQLVILNLEADLASKEAELEILKLEAELIRKKAELDIPDTSLKGEVISNSHIVDHQNGKTTTSMTISYLDGNEVKWQICRGYGEMATIVNKMSSSAIVEVEGRMIDKMEGEYPSGKGSDGRILVLTSIEILSYNRNN